MTKIEELEKQLAQVNKDLEANKQLLLTTIENVPLELLNLNSILNVIHDLVSHKQEILFYLNRNKLNNAVLD